MKRIGLLSDTHGWLDEAVFRHFENCDEIWHAGDIGSQQVLDQLMKFKPTRIVFGNIDDHILRKQTAETLRWDCEGLDVMMTHIGGKPGNYATTIVIELRKKPPQVFICGHSHLCLVKQDPVFKFLYMNPGAIGKHGFHHVRTMLRFEVESGKMAKLEVIELGKRA